MDDACYGLSFSFEGADAGPELLIAFNEEEPARGVLKIEGESIQRLLLEGATNVVLDSPGAEVSIPVGDYRWKRVYLDGGTMGAFVGTPRVGPRGGSVDQPACRPRT